MLLTNQISSIEGVKKVSIMMATPANKDIYRQSGLSTSELEEASANDMVVVADVDDDGLLDVIMEEVEAFFKKQSTSESDKKGAEAVRSWDKALGKLADANLAVISIPGAYAALEADRALDEGMNVFMFSDNVTLEDEIKLKKKAHEKGAGCYGTGLRYRNHPGRAHCLYQSRGSGTHRHHRSVRHRHPGTDHHHRPSGRGR